MSWDGFEPSTYWFSINRSTTELSRRVTCCHHHIVDIYGRSWYTAYGCGLCSEVSSLPIYSVAVITHGCELRGGGYTSDWGNKIKSLHIVL